MHVITRKRIVDFASRHPDCATALDSWYRIIKHARIQNFSELRSIFPSADHVQGLTVFNIGGNKVRLIANERDRRIIYKKEENFLYGDFAFFVISFHVSLHVVGEATG